MAPLQLAGDGGVSPFHVAHYAEEGLPVSGVVKSLLKNKVEANVDVVFWIVKDSASFHGHCKTDKRAFPFPVAGSCGSRR